MSFESLLTLFKRKCVHFNLHSLAAIDSAKAPRYPLNRRLECPQSLSGPWGEEKIIVITPEVEAWFIVLELCLFYSISLYIYIYIYIYIFYFPCYACPNPLTAQKCAFACGYSAVIMQTRSVQKHFNTVSARVSCKFLCADKSKCESLRYRLILCVREMYQSGVSVKIWGTVLFFSW